MSEQGTDIVEDPVQDLTNSKVSYAHGVLELEATRPMRTGDVSHDLDLDTECLYFWFPLGGDQSSHGDADWLGSSEAISKQPGAQVRDLPILEDPFQSSVSPELTPWLEEYPSMTKSYESSMVMKKHKTEATETSKPDGGTQPSQTDPNHKEDTLDDEMFLPLPESEAEVLDQSSTEMLELVTIEENFRDYRRRDREEEVPGNFSAQDQLRQPILVEGDVIPRLGEQEIGPKDIMEIDSVQDMTSGDVHPLAEPENIQYTHTNVWGYRGDGYEDSGGKVVGDIRDIGRSQRLDLSPFIFRRHGSLQPSRICVKRCKYAMQIQSVRTPPLNEKLIRWLRFVRRFQFP